MDCDILNIAQDRVHEYYNKFTQKLKTGIDNLNKSRKEYPLKAAIGTATIGILEFSYIFGLLGRYNTFVDFAVTGTIILPLVTGFYLDRKKF